MTKDKNLSKERGLSYVRSVLAKKGWDATRLAREAGLSQSTLTRPLSDKKHPFTFSFKTLQAIESASGVPMPSELGGAEGARADPSLVLPADPTDASILIVEHALNQTGRKITPEERVRLVREFRELLTEVRGK